ncbi:hypothetical protein OG21DRAFT_1501473 [Imleria badia]|nr:hypothetical protein OG21DRAFT_1501473 [Imleria badia]
MSTTYAMPPSTAHPSTTSKAPPKPKPVNVFSNDGSFLEHFQCSKQEEEDIQKGEEALIKKKQFADRFKNRGKRPPPPDSPHTVTTTDLDPNPAKKVKRDDNAPQLSEYRNQVCNHPSSFHKDTGTGVHPLVKSS